MRIIRLFPDYGHLWPLWESGTDKYTMEPEDFGLSADLTSALRRWYDDWERNCPYDGTWPSIEHGRQWYQTGEQLACQLRREVKDFAEVSYEANQYID
jgi:hypothetical protein